MAGPQSAAPQPVYSSRPRKRFTLEQANKALPLVRRVVSDIVATRARAGDLQAQLESAHADQHKAIQAELDVAIDKLHAYLDELTEIGVELKDFTSGLIDFTGRHQGRDVYLCWKLGEERVAYFHELNSGFAGRVPVSMLQED
ncbi:MAG TPA: DUF2203 domain-containing protein [Tepidisphaeraceae bacterium]|nr:DUF2203 domain-containing protein [Tepidisphaeraceae bacterium]